MRTLIVESAWFLLVHYFNISIINSHLVANKLERIYDAFVR